MDLDSFDNMSEKDQLPFSDPVLRCDSCQALVRRSTLHKLGSCNKCGNRRVRNLSVFNEKEEQQIKDWGFVEFLKEFEVVADE